MLYYFHIYYDFLFLRWPRGSWVFVLFLLVLGVRRETVRAKSAARGARNEKKNIPRNYCYLYATIDPILSAIGGENVKELPMN